MRACVRALVICINIVSDVGSYVTASIEFVLLYNVY